MLCFPQAHEAAANAIAVAHTNSGTVGTSNIGTMMGYINEAQSVVLAQSSTFGGLGSVLAKIKAPVKIVNDTANICGNKCFKRLCSAQVHPYSKMAWQIVSSVYKAS
jgi:hypothetical protein